MLFHLCTISDVNDVLEALKTIRTPFVVLGEKLYPIVSHALSERSISFVTEYQLGPGSRFDFLTIGGTGLEIKKRGSAYRTGT